MASNSRGGLSKREYAAKQSGGNIYKSGKSSVSKSVNVRNSSKSSGKSSKTPAPLAGAGPLLPGQSRVANSYSGGSSRSVYAGPSPQGKVSPGYYDYSNSEKVERDRKTNQKKNDNQNKLYTGGNNLLKKGMPSFDSSSQRDLAASAMDRQQGRVTNVKASDAFSPSGNLTSTDPTALGRLLQILGDPTGMFKGEEKPDLGLTEMLGINDWLRTPTAYAADNEFMNNQDMTTDQPYVSPGQFETPNQNEADTRVYNPYSKNYQTQKEQENWIDDNRTNANDLSAYNYYQNQVDALENNLNNMPTAPTVAGAETFNLGNYDNQLAVGPSTVNSGGYSDLGNQQQMGTDYEKMFKTQEKNLSKNKKGDLSALDSLINQASTEGQQSLNEDKGQALGQLASLFAAYGTSDSEQRMQQQQRTNTDYAGKLANLLGQLSNQRAQGTNDINQSYNTAKNSIAQNRMNASMQVQKMLQDAAQQSFENKLKLSQLGQSNLGNVRSGLSNLASGWMNGVADPYSKPGGREVISQQMAAMYGGSPSTYGNMLPNGWEGLYAQPQELVNLGNGYVMDQATGDVYQAY